LTHANIVANVNSILAQIDMDRDGRDRDGRADCGVFWLPPYHDMGLIGGIFTPMIVGGPTVLMSPLSFLADPALWLEAITEYRGTISAAPNFAYDLCLRKIAEHQIADLNLGSWRIAISGAEPVQHNTMLRFAERFAQAGFQRTSFMSCYGLAEATLLVSGTKAGANIKPGAGLGEAHDGSLSPQPDGVASVGLPAKDTLVIVVDPTLEAICEDGETGEIWCQSPCVASGYWNNEQESHATFAWKLAADPAKGAFLRTGDLGVMQDGELYITGRLKDVMIVRGQNYYPQDIENTAIQSDPRLRAGCIAAFEVNGSGGQEIVLVAEPTRRYEDGADDDIWNNVRRAVAEAHGITLGELVIIERDTSLKTSSGKPRRRPTRDAYLKDTLAVLDRRRVDHAADDTDAHTARGGVSLPGSGDDTMSESDPLLQVLAETDRDRREAVVLEWICGQVAEMLGYASHAEVDTEHTLAQLGFDSLAAVELRDRLAYAIRRSLSAAVVFAQPSIASLAHYATAQFESAEPGSEVMGSADTPFPQIRSDPEHRHDPFPLTEIQRAYLVGRRGVLPLGEVSTHLYFEADLPALDNERLKAALVCLIARHDMLRAVISSDGTQQVLSSVPPVDVTEFDATEASTQALARHIDSVRSELSHEVRPSDQWPLFELRVTRLPNGHALLHGSLDMLVLDVSSIQTLAAETVALYGDPAHDLGPLGITFRDYVLAEKTLDGTESYERSRRYWMERLATLPAGPGLPLRQAPATLERQLFVRRTHRITAALWERIKARAAESSLTPSIVVLSAFAQVLARWSTSASFVLNVTVNNRLPLHPQVDALVGDFTNVELLEVDLQRKQGLRQLAAGLQSRLWEDLEHRYFSGLRVLQELARVRQGGSLLFAPVVFTSALGRDLGATNRVTYGISQTPQVLLDHQVLEANGELVLYWDSLEEIFPEGMLDAMFDAYCRYLSAIAEQESLWHDA
jgi:hypothetical protein